MKEKVFNVVMLIIICALCFCGICFIMQEINRPEKKTKQQTKKQKDISVTIESNTTHYETINK